MPMDTRSLIIHTGGVEGLTAVACQDRPERCVLWHPHLSDRAQSRRRHAIVEQATIFAIDEIIDFDATDLVAIENQKTIDHQDVSEESTILQTTTQDRLAIAAWSILLLQAVHDATQLRCKQVVWPIHLGDATLENQIRITEMHTLVSHLTELDESSSECRLVMPFIDLSDVQLIDLAARSDVSLRSAWWCSHDTPQPCSGCDGCVRWTQALHESGIPDPWRTSTFV